jgi:hypothetical protein
VERASQASVLEASEAEVDAPVGAVPADQPESPQLVAEEDQLLPQQGDGHDRPRSVELLAERSRLPVLAQDAAARRARPTRSELAVHLDAHHQLKGRHRPGTGARLGGEHGASLGEKSHERSCRGNISSIE